MSNKNQITRIEKGLSILEPQLKEAYNAGDLDRARDIGIKVKTLREELSNLKQEEIDLQKLDEVIQTSREEQPKPSFADRLKTGARLAADIPRSFLKGATLGTLELAGLPGTIQQGAESMIPEPTPEQPRAGQKARSYLDLVKKLQQLGPAAPFQNANQLLFGNLDGTPPSGQQLIGLLEKVPGAKAVTQYDPITPLGDFSKVAGEFIGPGGPFLQFGKKGFVDRLKRTSAIGGAAAVPAYFLEDSPALSIPLSILAGGATAFATAPSRADRVIRETMKGVSDEELALAKELQKQAKILDIPITATELIDNGLIRSLGTLVYGTEKGSTVLFNAIKNRPERVEQVAADFLDQIIKNPQSLRGTFDEIAEVAEKSIKNARKIRNQKAQKFYNVADTEHVETLQIQRLVDDIDQVILGLDRKDPTILKLKNLKQSLIRRKIKAKDQPEILDDLGQPVPRKEIIIYETQINKLDNVLKRFSDMVVDSNLNIAKEGRFIDKNSRRLFTSDGGDGILNQLDDILRTNANYSEAKDIFIKYSDELVDPIIKNVAPLAKNNITPNTIKNFIFNQDKNNANDIIKTYKILNETDPTAFPKLVRSYLSIAVDKKLTNLTKEGKSLASGFNLSKFLAGTDNQQKNLEIILRGVAEAQGKNPNEFIKGFKNFNNILARTARIANVDNPKAAPSEQFIVRDAAQIGSFMWHVKFAAKAERFVKNKTIDDLAKIFTDENSIELMEQLGKTNPASDDAYKLVRRILYVTNNLKTEEERNRENFIQQQQQGLNLEQALSGEVQIPTQ